MADPNQLEKLKLLEAKVIELTERLKESEAKLAQMQKAESVGLLARSIAHDLNNQLTPVKGYLDMLLMQVDAKDPNYEILMGISQATQRSIDIVRRLDTFSRPPDLKKQVLKLEHLIEEIARTFPQVVPSTIQPYVIIEPGLKTVLADEAELKKVIVALIANACDAMPKAGKLTIRVENGHAGGVTVSHGTLAKPHVVISVVDSGEGMTPEALRRVFEPFFSTKRGAEGAGLGLSMAYQIAKAHDGWIDVSTELGKGTAFQIYLPAYIDPNTLANLAPGPKTMKEAANEPDLPRGSGKILFVDDEERIRTMGEIFLERLGYSVDYAIDGQDAVEKYAKDPSQFVAVISDMTMPRMNGRQMLKDILEINPRAIVILSSGYTDEGTHDDLIRLGAADFISKPYTIRAFAQSIHRCLAKQSRESFPPS